MTPEPQVHLDMIHDSTSPIPRITIADAGRHVGETVQIPGWLYNLRRSGKIAFPIVRDGSGLMQCVAVKSVLPEQLFETIKNLTQESSIIVVGKIRAEQRAPGGYEMDLEAMHVVQRVPESDPYPITPKEHGPEFLMDHRHLWLRSQRQHAIIRVRHEIIKAIRDYFDSHGFTLVDTPIFTPAACEGTTALFEVDYFEDNKAYLTQSGQLYNEANAMAFGKVYCFGPTFRAEKSKTRRHLTEFWMVEPEMAYATLEDVKRVAEEMVVFIVGRVLENRREELKRLERDVSKLAAIQAPFPRMSYDDAVKILQSKGSEIQWGGDFGGTDETLLTADQERPIMVDRFPASFKAFYFERDPEREDLVLGVDVLAPEGYGEIIGGGQRVHDADTLLKRIEEAKLPKEAFDWYIDLRKYGSVPHGGFGMGVERCVAWICGLEHIRETIAFPRMLYRLRP
jgi:asparaginyl-tRNA synthetase